MWCKATEHIGEQIAMIAAIEANGYAYRSPDGVYFDSSKQDDYGYLARLDQSGLDAGVRVALGDKRHATDFALWKLSRPAASGRWNGTARGDGAFLAGILSAQPWQRNI